MQRTIEPEVMNDPEQAAAYDQADFSASHNRRVDVFRELAPPAAQMGHILDLGCGSGDLNFRLLDSLPECSMTAIDGAPEMIALAIQALEKRPEFKGRVHFIEGYIPSDSIPRGPFATIMSNSFLHHLHDPQVLWETIKQVATPNSFIFVSDLRRPSSHEEARNIVETLASEEKEILKRDFYNSLLAAFEPSEVERQLQTAGIKGLTVRPLDDIHLVVFGFVQEGVGA